MTMLNNKVWLAIYTKPRHEKKAADRLAKQGIEVFCPMIQTRRQWSDRKKKVTLPMFPSYVFVHIEKNERNQVLQDPSVLNFVFWLGQPAIIRDREIEVIKYIAGYYSDVEITAPDFQPGEYVTIHEGPFAGIQGIIEDTKKDQILLFIESIGFQIRIYKYQVSKNS